MSPHLNPLPEGEEIFPFSLREKVRMRGPAVGIRRATFRAEGQINGSPLCSTTGKEHL